MFKVEITENNKVKTLFANEGDILSTLLTDTCLPHPCGGMGICKKCTVIIDGKKELSCQYRINKGISVEIIGEDTIVSPTGARESEEISDNMCLCLDIGTTTLVMALVSQKDKAVIKTAHRNNPQRKHGADIMSRIDFVTKNGVGLLQRELLLAIKEMRQELFNLYNIEKLDKLYVSGNTTMLHIFLGVDCSSIGVAPYTPKFLECKTIPAHKLGIDKIGEIITLPCISSFVGADIVAGLSFIGLPSNDGYYLLLDLGTNAEIALCSKDKIYCTSAAAGPCFEGAGITCGMSAVKGAVSSVSSDGSVKTIGDAPATGICATGLIDTISFLLNNNIIDETGYMETEKYNLTENVFITREDVRHFQNAKSAIFSALSVLFSKAQIYPEKIEKVFICGGFSDKINGDSLVNVGLIHSELKNKISTVNNSSLLGTVKFACENNDLSIFTDKASFIDLAGSVEFSRLYIENMLF